MTYDEQCVNSICMNHSWNITCQHVAVDIYRTKQSTEHAHGYVLKDIERVRREWKRIPYVNDIVCACPSATHFCFFSTHFINWNNPYRSKATDRKHQLALWFNSINLMFRVGNFGTIYFVVINEYLFHSKRVKLNKLFAFLILSAHICLLIVHSSAFYLSKNALMMNSNIKTTSKLFAYLFFTTSLCMCNCFNHMKGQSLECQMTKPNKY